MSINLPFLFRLVIISISLDFVFTGNSGGSLLNNDDSFIPHAFIQTGEELHYFSDVAEHEIIFTGFTPEQGDRY